MFAEFADDLFALLSFKVLELTTLRTFSVDVKKRCKGCE
jgi:hypothetical protein